MYQAAAALNASSRWQEAIAENLASSSIPGFKKQDLSFSAVSAKLQTSGVRPTMPKAVLKTNFQPGELKFKGVNTDVALEGKGFFKVQLPDGNIAYLEMSNVKVVKELSRQLIHRAEPKQNT